MKAIFTIALAAAVTYAVIKVLEHADKGVMQPGVDAANPPSSLDDIPTLRAARDAQPPREDDLNVARNATY
jgi:hypothetical protein